MIKKCLLPLAGSLLYTISFAQDTTATVTVLTDSVAITYSADTYDNASAGPVYKLKPAIDIPLTVAGTAFSLYGFSQIYNKDASTDAEILSLRKSNINDFDRWAAGKYSKDAANASDMLFYGSMPLPLLLMLDKHIRKDAAKIGFLYLETLAVTGIFYTGTPMLVDRYRPFVYNTDVPLDERKSGNSKNSFLAGHPAMVATSTFFIAKVFADYHPESNVKWLFYTLASASTLTTAYLRHRAGKHFPSDLLTGMAVGTLSGILVPQFHKQKLFKNKDVSLMPYFGHSKGLLVTYRF